MEHFDEVMRVLYDHENLQVEKAAAELRLAIAKGENADDKIEALADKAWEGGFLLGLEEAGRVTALSGRKIKVELNE